MELRRADRTAGRPQRHRRGSRSVVLDGDGPFFAEVRTQSAAGAILGPYAIGESLTLVAAEELQGAVRAAPHAGVAADAARRIEHRNEGMERCTTPGSRRSEGATAEEAPFAGIDEGGPHHRPAERVRGQDFEVEWRHPPAAQQPRETRDVVGQVGCPAVAGAIFARGSGDHQHPHPVAPKTGEIPQAEGVETGDPRRRPVSNPCAGEERRRPVAVFSQYRRRRERERGLGADHRADAAAVAAVGIEPYSPPVESDRAPTAGGDTGRTAGGEMTMVQTAFATEPWRRVAGRRPGLRPVVYHPGAAPGR